MKAKDSRVMIGDECFFNNDCSIVANNLVDIGRGCLFGEGVKIYDHNHRFNNKDIPLKKQGYSDGEVHIGRHCWIGSGVIILKGADISDNCVVGAGCVITGHIEEGSLVKQNNELVVEQIKERETSNDYNKSAF